MKSSKLNAQRPACEEAEQYLQELGEVVGTIQDVEALVEQEIAVIRGKHSGEIQYYKAMMADLEKALTALMKTHRDELFADKDKVELLHGLLLYARGPHVVIPRDALGKIEEMGWIEAVRVAKSVARDVVQQWPDERLEVIGAKRTMKETYSYELKAGSREHGA